MSEMSTSAPPMTQSIERLVVAAMDNATLSPVHY
jgi:hypothetical protein